MPIRSLVIALAACAPELDEAKTSASETPTTGEVTTTTTTSPTSTPAPLPVCPDADPLPGVDVAVDASCAASGWTVDWTAVQVEWALPIVASLGQPAVGDLDGDGIPEVVLADVDNDLWAFSGDGAGPLWELELPGLYFDPSPSIADLDGDGDLDVVTISFQFEGYSVVGVDGATGLPLWESVLPWGTVPFNAVLASIVTADLEGDGAVEVIVGNVVLAGADGQRLGQGPMGTGSLYCEVGYTLDRSTLPAVAGTPHDRPRQGRTPAPPPTADRPPAWGAGTTERSPGRSRCRRWVRRRSATSTGTGGPRS